MDRVKKSLYLHRLINKRIMLANYEILNSIKNMLPEVMPQGGKVLLFGSQARGEARHDSDWDLLILLPKDRIKNDDFDNVAYPLIEFGWSVGAEINPLLYTYSDWEKRNFTPFYKNVKKDSIELWH